MEDQRLLANFMPLLIDVIPKAAAEIEADISVHSTQGCCLVANHHQNTTDLSTFSSSCIYFIQVIDMIEDHILEQTYFLGQ